MGRISQKKKKRPVTQPGARIKEQGSSSLPDSASSQITRRVIRRFHILHKHKARLQKATENVKTASRVGRLKDAGGSGVGRKELVKVEEEMNALGGLERYQAMSSIGQSNLKGGGSEKILIQWIKELCFNDVERQEVSTKLELLDVGALKHDNYKKASSLISATPIDLNSRHPQILQQDFMQISSGAEDPYNLSRSWDVVSLSLVLNFVPDLRERGHMLSLAYRLLKTDGLLFIVLPLPCVNNSRYLTVEHWRALMKVVGFEMVKERWKPGGKVGYWLFRKHLKEKQKVDIRTFGKKVVLRDGAARNNFCILID